MGGLGPDPISLGWSRVALGAGPSEGPSAPKDAREVAKSFEEMLVTQLIGAMRKTIGDSGLLEASPERRVLDGAFDQELAHAITERGDLGIARLIERQILEQESRSAGTKKVDSHLPLRGRVTSGFGPRIDPVTQEPQFHGGVDVAAPAGTEIRAALAGEVVHAGPAGGFGNQVVIRSGDDTLTRYAHTQEVRVEVGQSVALGDVIATVGSTGKSTGPHLHFGLERGGKAVDPSGLLGLRVAEMPVPERQLLAGKDT